MDDLKVKELTKNEVSPLVDYWMSCTNDYLMEMGADPTKLPNRDSFSKMLYDQLSTPIERKKSYALIWFYQGKPVGHNNVNDLKYGEEAFMHLHLWKNPNRKKGLGTQFLKLAVPLFFENLKLDTLWCQPYAHNPAPNKVLPKVGFTFQKKYTTTPGSLNFEQEVNLWKLTSEEL